MTDYVLCPNTVTDAKGQKVPCGTEQGDELLVCAECRTFERKGIQYGGWAE